MVAKFATVYSRRDRRDRTGQITDHRTWERHLEPVVWHGSLSNED